MLPSAQARIAGLLDDDDLVLDVGGWAAPFNRADWVLDLMPFDTRGALGSYGDGPERFSADTWVRRDMCAREPWPFADDQFDFVVCATTLEDVRDPVWVCQEIARVGKAGYVEVPTLLAELIYDVQGPWLGHDHHRWICQVDEAAGEVVFTHTAHSIHSDWRLRVLPRWAERMAEEEHLQGLFWTGSFAARERVHVDEPFPLDDYAAAVRARFAPSRLELALKGGRERVRRRLSPLRDRAVRGLTRARRTA